MVTLGRCSSRHSMCCQTMGIKLQSLADAPGGGAKEKLSCSTGGRQEALCTCMHRPGPKTRLLHKVNQAGRDCKGQICSTQPVLQTAWLSYAKRLATDDFHNWVLVVEWLLYIKSPK